MTIPWWELPANDSLLRDAVADLRDGISLVLDVAPHAVTGLCEAVRGHVRRCETLDWRAVDCAGIASNEPRLICRNLAGQLGVESDGGPRGLAAKIGSGSVIWLEGVPDSNASGWAAVLGDYALGCREYPGRPSALCIASAALPGHIRSETTLRRTDCRNRLRRCDLSIFFETRFAGRNWTPLTRRAGVAVAVEIAGADPGIAASLGQSPPTALADPLPVLRALARERGWKRTARVCECLDGIERDNSAWLTTLDGGAREIGRRIWNGHVSVIFPHLEDRRLDMLDEMKPYLRPLPEGDDRKFEDLDWGSLVYLMYGSRPPTRLWDRVTFFRDLRNALAHREPLTHADLSRLATV